MTVPKTNLCRFLQNLKNLKENLTKQKKMYQYLFKKIK